MSVHMKMLIVEDHDDMRISLTHQFELENFDIDTASDGNTGLSKMKENDYDIVLLDLKLPGMDGMTILKEIRRERRLPNVIVITAVNDLPTAQECLKLGARDYISKPYDPEELLDVV